MGVSESLSVPKLSGEALAAMTRIGRARSPAEACGLLLVDDSSPDQRVIELPNRSMTPQSNYEFTSDDVWIALQNNGVESGDCVDVAIWHTHPGGSMGPSTEDLVQKIEDIPYLVVTLFSNGSMAHQWF